VIQVLRVHNFILPLNVTNARGMDGWIEELEVLEDKMQK
jgi:hypothetical protein